MRDAAAARAAGSAVYVASTFDGPLGIAAGVHAAAALAAAGPWRRAGWPRWRCSRGLGALAPVGGAIAVPASAGRPNGLGACADARAWR